MSLKKNLFVLCVLFGCALLVQAESKSMYITVVGSTATKKEDVAIKLDKKDVAVSDFVAVDVSSRSPEILSHPGGRRQYVLLFDLLHNQPANIVEARKLVSVFLDKLGPDDLIAVAEIGKTSGLRLMCGFTNDRNKIHTALNHLGVQKIDGVVQGPDGNLYSLEFSPQTNSVSLIPDDKFLANLTAGMTTDEKKKLDTPSMFITAFGELVYSLASVDGRKNIILFSTGFETKGAKIEMSEENFSDSYVDSAIREENYIPTAEEERAMEEQRRTKEREPAAPTYVQVEGIPEFVSGTFTAVQMISP